MVIEATRLKGVTVRDSTGLTLGKVDRLVFRADQARLVGFQVSRSGLVKKFAGLDLMDVLSLSSETVVVDDVKSLETNLTPMDAAYRATGSVLGIKAKTESGQAIGVIGDVVIEAETGGIVRFYLRNFLTERIIPLKFLVSISPKEIIFKDIVNQPIFDQVASSPEAAGA